MFEIFAAVYFAREFGYFSAYFFRLRRKPVYFPVAVCSVFFFERKSFSVLFGFFFARLYFVVYSLYFRAEVRNFFGVNFCRARLLFYSDCAFRDFGVERADIFVGARYFFLMSSVYGKGFFKIFSSCRDFFVKPRYSVAYFLFGVGSVVVFIKIRVYLVMFELLGKSAVRAGFFRLTFKRFELAFAFG